MIKESNDYFNTDIHIASSKLTSRVHVSWVMELVAQGMLLPLESIDVVQGSVKIYSAWLTNPSLRPQVIIDMKRNDPFVQKFYQNLYIHSSLLFTPRPNFKKEGSADKGMEAVMIHLELCRKLIIAMLTPTLINNSDVFTLETWTVVLKVFIAICDCLLETPKSMLKQPNIKVHLQERSLDDEVREVGSILGDAICALLINVLN